MKKHGLLLCLLLPVGGVAQTDSVAPAACAQCHVEALTQPGTYMAHALETVDKSKCSSIIRCLPRPWASTPTASNERESESEYSVTDGTDTVTMPIRWAMGAEFCDRPNLHSGERRPAVREPVSWFRELSGLGPTMGYVGTTPANLHDAAGRLISQDEKLRCFGCHATDAVQGKQLTLDH